MFTGLIEELGTVRYLNSQELAISCKIITDDVKIGDSIAVNGTCLTVTKIYPDYLTFHVSPTTSKHSCFNPGQMRTGAVVNLERALAVGARLGGHIVSGHVDGKARIISVNKQGEDTYFEFLYPKELKHYIVNKGSVCIDGISLTISETRSASFIITVIPHTLVSTNLQYRRSGDFVHIEADIFARYLHHFYITGGNDEKDRQSVKEFFRW